MTDPARGAIGHGWFDSGNVRLFRRWWRPADHPVRAALINLHGLGDHGGLYPMVADALVPHGFAVHAYDQRGHGRSPGQRGYVRRWTDYTDDLARFVTLVRNEEQVPLFLMGNSLGGLVVLDYAEQSTEQPAGVIAVAPALGEVGVPRVLMTAGRILARVWPRFSLQTGMDLSGLSRDPAAVEAVLEDPLFHRYGTARLAAEVPRAIERVQAAASQIRCPLLILHGRADRMVPPEGSRHFINHVAVTDRELREYPGAYHALFADLDAPLVLRDLTTWLEAHLDPT